jgi:type IV secretory pathway VirB3-like protein
MQWDTLAVAETRPAMKGGMPFWGIFPVFFVPAILTVITFKIYLLLLIPVLWMAVKLLYLGNHNRPFEWFIWVSSGAVFADWKVWGGISDDPHTATTEWDGLS